MFDPACSPEMELLLCCARLDDRPATQIRIAELAGGKIDWVRVFRIGLVHGTLPVLGQRLSEVAADTVPRATLSQLNRYTARSAQRNLAMVQELLEVLKLLESRGIPAAPFKGPTLADWIYPAGSSRQYGDLDVLVRGKDVLRAGEALLSRGYHPWKDLTPEEEGHCLKTGKDRPYLSGDGAFAVEIHWRFAPVHASVSMDAEALWPRVQVRQFAGYPVLGIPDEDLLLILCVHGTRHEWSSLKWICDVAALVSTRSDLDWGRVMKDARRLGVERMVFIGMILARGLLGAAVPDRIAKALDADETASRLAAQAWQELASMNGEAVECVARYSYQMAARERMRDRLRILLSFARSMLVQTGRDKEVMNLPAALNAVYYLLRPVRLIASYGFRPLRQLIASAAGSAPRGR
jgi:hypothetical protein